MKASDMVILGAAKTAIGSSNGSLSGISASKLDAKPETAFTLGQNTQPVFVQQLEWLTP
jgi:hypothetical protein